MATSRPALGLGSVRPLVRRRAMLASLAVAVLRAGVLVALGRGGAANDAFLSLVGGAALVPAWGHPPTLVSFVVALLPLAALCYLLSDYVREEVEQRAHLVIVRVTSRKRWATGSLVGLTVTAALSTALGDVLGYGALCALGNGFAAADMAPVLAGSLALEVPASVLLVLLINACSLRLESVVASVIVFGIHAATLLLVANLPVGLSQRLVPLLASAHEVLAWHDVAGALSGLSQGPQGFGVAGSAGLLVALSALVAFCLVRALNSRDLV